MKSLKYIYFAAAFSMVLTGCSDFLDVTNKKNPDDADKNYGSNPTAMLVSAYDAFRPLAYEINLTEHGTDLYINPRGNDDNISTYLLNPETDNVKSYYSNAFKAVNYSNGVIKYASATSSDSYEARFLRAWGYYLLTQQFGAVPYITSYIQTANRDYPRTELSEIYSKCIEDLTDLYNNSSLKDQDHDGHASKQAVAALLAKFYLAAGWDLNTTLTDAAKGTYTVDNKANFEQAAAWAEKAIKGIKLTMSFEDKWSPSNEGNAEEIFSIQYERNGYKGDVAKGGHSLQNDYMGYYGNCVNIGLKGTGSGGTNHLSSKAIRLFEKGDARFEGTFMTTFYNWDKQNWPTSGYFAYYTNSAEKKATLPIALKYYPYYVTPTEAVADINAHKAQFAAKGTTWGLAKAEAAIIDENNCTIINIASDGTASVSSSSSKATSDFMKLTNNGYCVKKFDDPESDNVTGDNDYRDIVIFHVSDMYLIAAEAYLLAGNEAAALEKVNDVRQRAGLARMSSFNEYKDKYEYSITTAFGEVTPLDVILDERARELYAERTRWEDLRRTKQLVRYNLQFNRNITDISKMENSKGEIKWYRPIPAAEINTNTGISEENQNPGY